jgi:hypothetical protein
MASFQNRVIGVLKLDAATFEDIEHDTSALGQAATIVALAALASAIGWFWISGGVIRGVVVALFGWAVAAGLIWLIGTRVLPDKNTKADFPEVLRVIGFAQAPGLLHILAIIPILGWLASLAASIWVLAASVVGVRQALDYETTGRAIAVCVIAWIANICVWFVLRSSGFAY